MILRPCMTSSVGREGIQTVKFTCLLTNQDFLNLKSLQKLNFIVCEIDVASVVG